MNAMGGARSQKTQFGCGVVVVVSFSHALPLAWYPFGQGPHVATKLLFVHVRCDEQPPLFFLHGSSFAHFVVPSAWYPVGQGPQLAFPLVFVHLRCEEQPPLFLSHGLSFSHFVAPRAWYPFGQGPHDFLPFEYWHVRCEEQPPLLLKHGLVVVVVVVGVQIP